MHIIQAPLFDFELFIAAKRPDRLVMVLEAIPAEKLLAVLERERWTGRKGHSIRGMWSALIAGLLHRCTSVAQVARLLERDREVRLICGFGKDDLPGEDALGRFIRKLAEHQGLVEECFDGLVERLKSVLPGFGAKIAVDSTDIKAYSNGHRKAPSDPDARWGAKKKGGNGEGKKDDIYYWFGYKLHLVVDAHYELPVSFVLTPANEADTKQMKPLLAKAAEVAGKPEAVIADKGYDSQENCRLIYREYGAAPIIPIREKEGAQLPDICNAKGTPTCAAGTEMVFWGRDGNHLKYRCPQALGKGPCPAGFSCTSSPYGYVLKLPIGDDLRRNPPVPRETKKWQRLYRLRTSIERVNSRLKELLGLNEVMLRGVAKVTLRSALILVVMLGAALGMAQCQRLNELRSLVT